MESKTMVFTGDGIRFFQIRAAIAAIKLEKRGMKHSRGNVKAHWAKHFGMSARAKHDDVINRMELECSKIATATSLSEIV